VSDSPPPPRPRSNIRYPVGYLATRRFVQYVHTCPARGTKLKPEPLANASYEKLPQTVRLGHIRPDKVTHHARHPTLTPSATQQSQHLPVLNVRHVSRPSEPLHHNPLNVNIPSRLRTPHLQQDKPPAHWRIKPDRALVMLLNVKMHQRRH
jgi:hypothetical protein